MHNIISLKRLRGQDPMEQVQVRLPPQIRQIAKSLAEKQSSHDQKLTETDVYRTAILLFLDEISTDSREQRKGGVHHSVN